MIATQNISLPLPASLVTPVGVLQDDITASLQDAGGLVAQMPDGDVLAIGSDVKAVVTAAAPLVAGTDATQASPAIDAANAAQAVGIIVGQSVSGQARKLVLMNPNLFRLAGQYYGDPTRWQEIATASNLSPPDPQPIGTFLIVIPVK